MANKNPDTSGLRPYRFTDEDREKAKKALHEKVTKRKTFREVFDALLSQEYTTKDGDRVTGVEMAAMKVMEQIMVNGNMEAFKIARDTVGEKPVEKVMVADVDPDVISEVEQAVLGEMSNGNDTDAGSDIPEK